MTRNSWRVLVFCLVLTVLAAVLWTGPFWTAYTQVSPSALRGLPQRMARVRPGMTEDQMWSILAIPRGCSISEEGSGPRSDYRWGRQLPYGCRLYYVLDMTRRPAIFKRGDATRHPWP